MIAPATLADRRAAGQERRGEGRERAFQGGDGKEDLGQITEIRAGIREHQAGGGMRRSCNRGVDSVVPRGS
eukprot:2599784-Pyramimonas_sp.AAC.1